jgi:hypothetical protein
VQYRSRQIAFCENVEWRELGNEMAIRGINVAREGSDERNKATGTLLTSRSISFSGGSQAMQFDLLRHIN